jgi:hypothetical protein
MPLFRKNNQENPRHKQAKPLVPFCDPQESSNPSHLLVLSWLIADKEGVHANAFADLDLLRHHHWQANLAKHVTLMFQDVFLNALW